MNIMHNKTVTFITQLRHATQWCMNNTNKRSIQISAKQPKLDKFQLQCYSKCSKWRPLFSTQ